MQSFRFTGGDASASRTASQDSVDLYQGLGLPAFGPSGGSLAERLAAGRALLGPDTKRRRKLWVTDQSGLSYSWEDGYPSVPEDTEARRTAMGAKRGMDIVLGLMALVLFGPALLLVMLAIKLDSRGPVFFRQERVGLFNRSFRVYKFRTMYVDRQDPTGVAQTTGSDPRVTRVGRFLRRTSLDEMPQILNIVRGEMSIVGPRPHVAGMLAGNQPYDELVPYYDFRHLMRPGLTGWAQANGLRGPTTDAFRARQRVDHDIAYIQNFSLWLDIAIIIKTGWREFITGTGV